MVKKKFVSKEGYVMSMTVGYKPYTGTINTNSARYKRAKAMYDEGHLNGEETKSATEAKVGQNLQNLKIPKQIIKLNFPLCRRSDSLEHVLKMLFARCASHLVGDLCQMKGA